VKVKTSRSSPGGFDIRNDQVADHIGAIQSAQPDAIVSGGFFRTRAVQAVTRKIPHVALSEDMVADGFVTSFHADASGVTTRSRKQVRTCPDIAAANRAFICISRRLSWAGDQNTKSIATTWSLRP
jgi:hypothetical protein